MELTCGEGRGGSCTVEGGGGCRIGLETAEEVVVSGRFKTCRRNWRIGMTRMPLGGLPISHGIDCADGAE